MDARLLEAIQLCLDQARSDHKLTIIVDKSLIENGAIDIQALDSLRDHPNLTGIDTRDLTRRMKSAYRANTLCITLSYNPSNEASPINATFPVAKSSEAGLETPLLKLLTNSKADAGREPEHYGK